MGLIKPLKHLVLFLCVSLLGAWEVDDADMDLSPLVGALAGAFVTTPAGADGAPPAAFGSDTVLDEDEAFFLEVAEQERQRQERQQQQPHRTEAPVAAGPDRSRAATPGRAQPTQRGAPGEGGQRPAFNGFRRRFPETEPTVCLAFLSCCGRTDLLQKTMWAAVRHMEEDEPLALRYEIAWLDNGSPGAQAVADKFQVEHVALLAKNRGLAYGMNRLFLDPNPDPGTGPHVDEGQDAHTTTRARAPQRSLCTAPYVLLLEEDWLFLDATVAPQTPLRRHAVSRAVDVVATAARSGWRAWDGARALAGAFLRPETYDSFLFPPHAGPWQTHNTPGGVVEFKPYCMDPVIGRSGYLWGSYTNGAGLYNRSALREQVGRMYGEPGEGFHDAYTEANYAYRVGTKFCHAAVRMEEGCDGVGGGGVAGGCSNAAFQHVGGGRGTRPNKKKDVRGVDDAWVLYGTPALAQLTAQRGYGLNAMEQGGEDDDDEAEEEEEEEETAVSAWTAVQEEDQQKFQASVAAENAEVFLAEERKRGEMRAQAAALRSAPVEALRAHIKGAEHYSAADFIALADSLEARADSPHPLPGFWDGMGAPQTHGAAVEEQGGGGGGGGRGSGGGAASAESEAARAWLRAQAAALRQLGSSRARIQGHEAAVEVLVAMAAQAEAVADDDGTDPTQMVRAMQLQQAQQEQQMQQQQRPQQKQQQMQQQMQQEMLRPQMQQQMLQQQQQALHQQMGSSGGDGGGGGSGVALRAAAEHAAWVEAVNAYQRSGRRAFTGAGYQEQHRAVQEAMGRWDAAHTGLANGDGGGSGGLWATFKKIVFGP